MPTPHKHAALIKQLADDPSQPIWYWDGTAWQPDETPLSTYKHYTIGPKPTQPPRKMCSLAGVEFPAPETVAPPEGTPYWVPLAGAAYSWHSDSGFHTRALLEGRIHLTREAAEQHSRALLAANKQAIEGAR